MIAIFNFSFNVEVGGQTIFSELMTLLAFFKIVIQVLMSSFLVDSYNELTRFFPTLH